MAQSHKLYGNSLHFVEGRFISGPDARSCIASFLMILVPSILWQVFVGTFFITEYSAFFTVFAVFLQVASLLLLLAATFSDPGIMPRQKDYSEYYDPNCKSYRQKQPSRYYDLHLRGHPFKLKWCTTCNIYRPPRCTHCAVCENCIERFDHHCPWIGNCVGKRNYRLFYAFVSTTGLLNAYVLATCVTQMVVLCNRFVSDHSSSGEAFVEVMRTEPVTTALAIYCAGIVWFTVGLCMYHTYLVGTNQTTYEQIKGAYTSSRSNPFYRGVVGNFQEILFSKVRPRYFNPYTQRLHWPTAASTDVDVDKERRGTATATSESGQGKGETSEPGPPKSALPAH